MTRFRFKIVLFLCASLLLGTCSSDNSNDQKYSDDGKPRYGGTLVVGVNNDVDSFNPLYGESSLGKDIMHMLLLGLADLNDRSEFTAELAERWEHSSDYKTLTYFLRKDAKWADGTPITAFDVAFTFDVLKDTTAASPNQWVTEMIKRISVVDSHTVKIQFTAAYPDQMFDTAGEFLPKHILKDVERKSLRSHAFGQNPLSSGPFKLKRWVHQQLIELEANESWFAGRPYLDRVVFKFIPDNTNRLIQLQTGEIDMMLNVSPHEVASLQKKRNDIDIYPISGRVYYYVGYNEKLSLFNNREARQALTMAIPRQQIIDAILYGFGSLCSGPIPPMIKWAYDPSIKPFAFDHVKAKELLINAGWNDSDKDGILDRAGKKFSFTLLINAGNQVKADVAVVLQEQWRKLGIDISIETQEWTAFLKTLRNRKFDAYIGGWSTSFNVDPTPIFHSTSDRLFNYISYSNSRADKLIEAGRAEMDREKAAAIWKEFQQVIHEDQPYTFLFWKDKVVAVHSRFRNVTPIPLSPFYNIEKWYEAASEE